MQSFTQIKAGLNFSEAAEYIGVSEMTVRRMVMRRQIVPVRIGRRVLFLRSELDRFLQASMPLAA